MKPLDTFQPLNPDSDTYSEDFNQWISEDFVNPLIELGAKFLGTISTNTGDDNGSHIFHFDLTDMKTVTKEDLKFLKGYDEGSNWDYFIHYNSLTFIINWSA